MNEAAKSGLIPYVCKLLPFPCPPKEHPKAFKSPKEMHQADSVLGLQTLQKTLAEG